MKPAIILCLAFVLSAGLFGCATSKSTNVDTALILQNIFKKIEQQLPKLALTGTTSGTSSPAETWKGEEFATARFMFAKDVARDPREAAPKGLPDNLARMGLPYLAFIITIHRYASSSDAQKDVEEGLHMRPATPEPKESYKGATLYQFTSGGGTVICQSDRYIVEISPMPRSGITQPLVMKVLDVALGELDSNSPKLK